MNVFYFWIALFSVPTGLIATNFDDACREDWHMEISEVQAQPSVQEESSLKLLNVKTEFAEPQKIEVKKTEETITKRQINWFNLVSGIGIGTMCGLATKTAFEKKAPAPGIYAAGCALAAYQLLKYSVTKTTVKIEKPETGKPKPAPKKRKIIFEFDEDDWMTP
ncbi:MAG TPA: hypothetical protein VFF04_04735 [Candidatus Babeliales bacterium]|nr:hypothetical protein [Candidatus Babeliales bacterium]